MRFAPLVGTKFVSQWVDHKRETYSFIISNLLIALFQALPHQAGSIEWSSAK
jgi:hypothetical protein